ncbi:hypothetical protein Tco_1353858 [Tanacetum coccineum]
MKRASKGYSRVNTPLFQTMLVQDQGEGPTIPVVSYHTPTSSPSTSQPPSIQTTPVAKEAALMPHDSPIPRKVEILESKLKQTKQTCSTALTKLIKRVKKLEQTIKTSQARNRAKVVISDAEEDPSKHGCWNFIVQLRSLQMQLNKEGMLKMFKLTLEKRRAVSTGSGGVSTASELVSTAGVHAKDKGKAIMQESEPPKKIKKRVQVQMSIDEELAQKVHEEEQSRFNAKQEVKFKAEQEQERLDHETAMKIQEELDAAERQRMAQVHQAAQGFTDDEWDDILARVAADKDFVQQLQAGEKVSDEDLPRKLVELVNQRKKFFAQQRAEAKRNKPMTPAQQKEYMSTYIKNQEGGYTLKQLKALSFEEVKEIFEATMRKVQSFVPMDSELEVQRLKRAGQYVVEEPAKRQRTGEALGSVQEQTCEEPKAEELSQEQLHQMMMVFLVEEVNVKALQNLVKERFRTTEPTEDKARELWVELKRLFEPDDNDTLWKLQSYTHDPLNWWLYDTCGVHHVSTERGHDIYMLVKKDYPLTKALATLMLCNKLRVD